MLIFHSPLDKVRGEHVGMSLELQQAFGLRREEAIKFQPGFADRKRKIPIRTEAQRDVLSRARRLAGLGALIPSDRNYVLF